MLGFFLTPMLTFACGKSHTKTEKSCCDKKTSQTDKKDCCKNKSSHNEKDNDDCGGKCGNSSCHCPTISFGFVPTLSEHKYNVLVVSKRQFFLYTNTYLSSGFHFIWQPPKIS